MNIYKVFIEQRFVNFDYDKLFSIAKEHGFVSNKPVDETAEEQKLYAFEYEDCKDIYFGNLYFHHVSNEGETSLQIYIKSPDEPWSISSDGGKYRPRNEVYRVFRKYNKRIFETDWVQNQIYDSGNWDKHVFRTIKDLSNFLDELTEYSRFQKVYKK